MLIVTIHDVAPPFVAEVELLRVRLESWGVDAVTLLAVPDHHRRAPIEACARSVAWLRERVRRGDEVALHGIHHRQEAPASRCLDRVRAGVVTAGEGEMLGDGADEPTRLAAARDRLAATIGAPVAGFVAPAWLEKPSLPRRLERLGFRWHETSLVVEGLGEGARRYRVPVIGFATRSGLRLGAALAWAAAMTPLAIHAPVARVALHPGDAHSPPVLAAAERALRRLVRFHRPVTTGEALRG
jgi:hypothetical protein